MMSADQLSVARHIWARQLDQAIEICQADFDQHGPGSPLGSSLMLCLWWQGDRECANELALELSNSRIYSIARPAIEIAASFSVLVDGGRDAAERARVSVTRLAGLADSSALALVLRCPGWFARSIDIDRGRPIGQRVNTALDAHVAWARDWLDATDDERRSLTPPPV